MTLGVFHAGALGDCVLALHVARAAAASAQLASDGVPADIGFVARSPAARLALGRSVVQSTWDLDAAGMSALFRTTGDTTALDPAVARTIRSFDAIISFCGGPDVPPAAHLRDITKGPVWAIDPRPRPETLAARRHITDQWIDDLRQAGLEVPVPWPDVLIRLEPQEREHGCQWWNHVCGARSSVGGRPEKLEHARRVLLHPGSGGKAKCWPLDLFEALAETLRADGRHVAWMIGPVEVDWYGPAFGERLARTAAVIYEEDILKAAAVIAAADVFVGNDAGITHLAAALGTLVVVVFGPTAPDVWRPLGPRIRTLCGSGCAPEPFAGVAVADVRRFVTDACGPSPPASLRPSSNE